MESDCIQAMDKFNEIWGKEEPAINQRCYVCDPENFKLISEIDRYGFFYPTGMCRICGCVQQTKYYTEECITDFYENWYRKIYGNQTPADLFDVQYNDRGRRIFDFLSSMDLGTQGLEIGCGSGGILKYFQEKGKTVTGLDFDETYLNFGRRKNLNLLSGSISNVHENNTYDFIILSHVLEHITYPVNFLRKIHSLLRKDGIVYIEVPSLERVANGNYYRHDLLKYLQNAHTIHFNEDSFHFVVEMGGFRVSKFDKSIYAALRRNEGKVSVTHNQYQLALKRSKSLMEDIERNRKSYASRKRAAIDWIRSICYNTPWFSVIKKNISRVKRR